jgi:Zn-finger nucleic acid-binding protein
VAPVSNCPNCGAPKQRDSNTGALVCRHCGTQEELPALVRDLEVGPESPQRCPLCITPLLQARLDGSAFLVCPDCQGMLIPIQVFVFVVEAARTREERPGVTLPRRQTPGDRTLACPICSGQMLSHIYGGPGNLVIDTCERCRVNWLDPGELRRIARAPHGRVWMPPPLTRSPDPGDTEGEDED